MPDATVTPVPAGGIPTETIDVLDLTSEAQDVRGAQLEVMEDRGVWQASLKVERMCALLDPRRKSLDDDHFVNGAAALGTSAEDDLKALIEQFAEGHKLLPASLPAPLPAPVEEVFAEPAPKRKKPSRMEERHEARVAAVVAGIGSGGVQSQASVAGRRVLIARETLVYFWRSRTRWTWMASFNRLGF